MGNTEILLHAAPVTSAYTFNIRYRTWSNERQSLTVLAKSSVDAMSKVWGKIKDFEDVEAIDIKKSEVVA